MANNNNIYSTSRRTQYLDSNSNKNTTVDNVVNKYETAMTGYNTFNAKAVDSLAESRLWHGVPKLTSEQMQMFEAAYSGHTFFFVIDLPKFMTTGAYTDESSKLNIHAQNLKSIIEKCARQYQSLGEISAQTAEMDDGDGRKITFATGMTQDQPGFSLTLHEFAGLPLKNAIETWMRGIFDPTTQHGNYYGNLAIDGGWCLANHSMSLLVVQVDPSWTEIQEAVFYTNIIPQRTDFNFFNFDKGEGTIIDNIQIQFYANEMRNKFVNEAAIAYMNNKILKMVNTSVYDSTLLDPSIKGITVANGTATVDATKLSEYSMRDTY